MAAPDFRDRSERAAVRPISVVMSFAALLLMSNIVWAQEDASLAQVESEERSIVREIMLNGAGSRLVIPGVATESGSPSALTISETAGFWSLGMELPSDQIPQRNMQSIIFGNGSIHRFSGEVRFDNAKLPVFFGEGDERHRLTFVLLSDVGYVYVRGQGRVVFPDGRTVRLGHEDDIQSPAQSASASAHPCSNISWVQKRLRALGYDPGPVDGAWGQKTKRALKAFQSVAGLEISGELDTPTCAKLSQEDDKATRVKRSAAEGTPRRQQGNLIAWSDVADSYHVRDRRIENIMVMSIFGDRYMIDAVQEGEFLTRAPGTYGGITIMGIRGKPPKVKPLLGHIESENPDPEFYSVLGVGSSLQLPEEWIRAFGLRLRGATMVIHEDGLLLIDVEKE